MVARMSFPKIFFYFFVVSLIVYNVEFVQSFSLQCNRFRFITRSQFSIIPSNSRSQITQIYSDSDDYSGGEESDSQTFNDDLDEELVDEEMVEEDDEDNDEMDENEEAVDGEPTSNSWQERRQSMNAERDRKSAAARAKLSWEEKYEDDPLRADTPTKTLEEELEPYEKMFVVVGDVSADHLKMRSKAWVHHMQWARRSALTPVVDAKVKWEYTRLSQDCMGPIGQVMGIKANTSAEVRELLLTEPLTVTGGVAPWKVFEFNQVKHSNVTWDMHDPRLFLGFDVEGSSKSCDAYEKAVKEHEEYHIAGGRLSSIDEVQSASKGETVMMQHPVMNHKRAVMMGRLIACEGESAVNGTMILFNAKTNADAERYISLDPLMQAKGVFDKKKTVISPINEQDVDGLNHMMARTFGEKTVLDQVHFMDPEDLLDKAVEELPGLEEHAAMNMALLKALDAGDVSYRYTRLSMTERYGGMTEAEGYAVKWNKKLEGTQRVRMSTAVDQESVDEDSLVAAVSEDDSSSSTADSSND